MGLLPGLRRGSQRWWLPCSGEATESIGRLLLAHGRGRPLDSALQNRLVQTLRGDPPLLIFSALSWPGDHVSISGLALWLADTAAGRFASGDAFLSAPSITPPMRQRWNKLRDHYRKLPFPQWLDQADLWLEVTGPAVPEAWRQQWPQLCPDGDEPATGVQSQGDSVLAELARVMQMQRSRDDSFRRQLDRCKLGALKQLAYGLSHEINNPLANISTRAQQLQRGESDPTRSATLQRIIEQVFRAHDMISDLMFYANPSEPEPKDHEIADLIESVADSFREELGRQDIRLEVTVPEEAVTWCVDRQMIAEAIRSLIRNAVEAIGCQGTIVVSLVNEDERLVIHVADSGPGLSDAAREHAFDPYFSGREAGRGLGLGLCRAYRIARLHHGQLTLAGGPIGCVASLTVPRQPT